ncbi:MAG TPA: serine/threonine-protein kinase [Blastocatellia bacterium]|jgi:serine/threonine-protein kinase|nr:serine/threonine-protein kinase [Blastocatellia bacterium]
MNPERWQRIEELFGALVDHPAAERDNYLARVCNGDEELRLEVLSLLARDTSEDFIMDPIASAALSFTAKPKDDLTGERVGSYRVTRLIGRGGMGAVYEAERDDEQFLQQVAIKIIKRGMDTDFVRDRFLRERQILASLDHPHIARLFDGGATPTGLPYFVMEFVAGEPITSYCRRSQLSVNEKLKLFRKVCSAVQHAHQRLVIHRDLKPSNILITEDGEPKLLDFGIAKLVSPDGSQPYTRTETALRLMTPEYASPEQARGQAIATTTDVYSLGVVLYELLTERRPHEFKTSSPAEIERAICDTEIDEPSKVVGQMTGAPTRLARALEGDLDNITLMAMRKEPERRYQSVEQFSEDIRRYLAGMPVAARKDTFGYRAGKFVRRHKAGVAILALVAILAVAMAVQAARIARERDRANQAVATAQAVEQSLVAMFEVADPGKARGNVITARELLDQGAEKVLRELKDQPAVQAKLLDTIGQLYQSIGLYDRAQPLMEEALKLRRQALGNESPDVATSLNHLGEVGRLKGDYARSEPLFREALAMRRKLLGDESKDVAESLHKMGVLLVDRGSFGEAESLLREALALRRKLFGDETAEVADSLHSLGRLMWRTGKLHEAELLYRQALNLRRKVYGADHPSVAHSLNNLAITLQEQGDLRGAETIFREALAMRRKLLGEEHPEVAVSLANLASVLQDQKEYDEAERLFRQVLTLKHKVLGEEHPLLANTMHNLAMLLRDKGDYEEAEALYRQSMAMRRNLLGDGHWEVGMSLYSLAVLLYLKGEYEEAEKMERQAIDTYLKSLQPDHWRIYRSRSHLGACLVKLKRYREAEEHLLAGYSGLKATLGDQHAETQKTVSRLIELYVSWGKLEKANPYRALSHANSNKPEK